MNLSVENEEMIIIMQVVLYRENVEKNPGVRNLCIKKLLNYLFHLFTMLNNDAAEGLIIYRDLMTVLSSRKSGKIHKNYTIPTQLGPLLLEK